MLQGLGLWAPSFQLLRWEYFTHTHRARFRFLRKPFSFLTLFYSVTVLWGCELLVKILGSGFQDLSPFSLSIFLGFSSNLLSICASVTLLSLHFCCGFSLLSPKLCTEVLICVWTLKFFKFTFCPKLDLWVVWGFFDLNCFHASVCMETHYTLRRSYFRQEERKKKRWVWTFRCWNQEEIIDSQEIAREQA